MTWNVHGSARPDVGEVVELVRRSKVDVVLFQEIQRRQATQIQALLGWPTRRWTLKHAPPLRKPEGLAVLSSFDVANMDTTVVSSRFVPPVLHHRRVAQCVVLRIGEHRTRVVNIHLASGSSRAQPMQLRRTIAAFGEIDVLGGDFNDTPNGPALQVLDSSWTPYFGGPSAWGPSDATSEPTQAIDHLVVRRPHTIRDCGVSLDPVTVRRISDHLPVIATVSLRRPPVDQQA